jgi:hypothetical protein
MNRNFIFVLIIAAIAVMTSCSSVKGVGRGYSDSEQVAVDKADMNALVDVARQNKVTVAEDSKIETTDIDGKSSTTYTDTRTLTTSANLTNVKPNRKVSKRGKTYTAVSKVNATVVEE